MAINAFLFFLFFGLGVHDEKSRPGSGCSFHTFQSIESQEHTGSVWCSQAADNQRQTPQLNLQRQSRWRKSQAKSKTRLTWRFGNNLQQVVFSSFYLHPHTRQAVYGFEAAAENTKVTLSVVFLSMHPFSTVWHNSQTAHSWSTRRRKEMALSNFVITGASRGRFVKSQKKTRRN